MNVKQISEAKNNVNNEHSGENPIEASIANRPKQEHAIKNNAEGIEDGRTVIWIVIISP